MVKQPRLAISPVPSTLTKKTAMSDSTAPAAQHYLTLPFFHKEKAPPFKQGESLPPGTIIIDFKGTRHTFHYGAIITETSTRPHHHPTLEHYHASEITFVWYAPTPPES